MFKQQSYILYLIIILMFSSAATRMWAQNSGSSVSYAGQIDHFGCDTISGWAADSGRLNTPINIEIYDSGVPLTSIPANQSRPDVGTALGDLGLHGFNVPTPFIFLDGQQHNISIRFETSATNVNGSPKLLTCITPPPAMSANHYITNTLPGKTSLEVINHFNRDSSGRTRYQAGDLVTINDPVARQTIVLNTKKATYSRTSWIAPGANNSSGTIAAATLQSLTTNPFDPGDFDSDGDVAALLASSTTVGEPDTAPCPTTGKGYSIANKPPSSGITSSSQTLTTIPTTVRIWTCISMSLPMYIVVDDPAQGKTVQAFRDLVTGEQPAQLFTVPAGFAEDDQFKGTVSGTGCALLQVPAPVLLLTNGAYDGQSTFTAMSNCIITNVGIQAGPSVNALPITLKGGSAVQVLFSDNGGSNTTVPGADVGIVNLTLSNGSTSVIVHGYAILTKF